MHVLERSDSVQRLEVVGQEGLSCDHVELRRVVQRQCGCGTPMRLMEWLQNLETVVIFHYRGLERAPVAYWRPIERQKKNMFGNHVTEKFQSDNCATPRA